MTICIATICENQHAVVVASDKTITAQFLALEFEHPGGKIESISNTCVGLTAGDALAHIELFRACRGNIETLRSPSIELIARQVQDRFSDLRRKRAEDLILKPRDMTLDTFYRDGLIRHLPTEISIGLDNAIQNATFPLEIIITGVDDSGAHIYSVRDPGIISCYDRLFYHAIGSGTSHALLSIIGNEHGKHKSIRETIYVVYEAKKKAELAQGVGEKTEMGIITGDGMRMLSDEEEDILEQIYTIRTTPRLDEVQNLIAQIPIEIE